MQLSQLSTVCVSSCSKNRGVYNQMNILLGTTKQMQPVWSRFHCCRWTEDTYEYYSIRINIINVFFPLAHLLNDSLSEKRHSTITRQDWFYPCICNGCGRTSQFDWNRVCSCIREEISPFNPFNMPSSWPCTDSQFAPWAQKLDMSSTNVQCAHYKCTAASAQTHDMRDMPNKNVRDARLPEED